MADLLNSTAHHAAGNRLLVTGGSIYEAFDGLGIGYDHDAALAFIENTATFQELGREYQHKVAGMVMAFAIVAVEADRLHRQ